MVRVLVSISSGPSSSSGLGHYVVFLGKTLLTVPLSTQLYMGTSELNGAGVTLRWTTCSIPSRECTNTPCYFMIHKLG